MGRTVKIILSVTIPLVFVGILYYYIDFSYFAEKVKQVEGKYLVYSFAALFAAYFFRVARFMILLPSRSAGKLFGISTLHYFFNRILPARSGEATLPVLLKKYLNISYAKGITGLLFIRVIDLYGIMLILVLATLGVSGFGFQPFLLNIIRLLAIIIILFSLLLFLFPKRTVKIISLFILWFSHVAKGKIRKKLQDYTQTLDRFINEMPQWFVPGIVIMSFGSWLLIYFYYYFIVLAFGIPYTLPEVTFASSISNLTLILPLSAVGNLGTFEAGWTAGFALLGMDPAEAVQIGLFSNIYATLITSLLAVVGWYILARKGE